MIKIYLLTFLNLTNLDTFDIYYSFLNWFRFNCVLKRFIYYKKLIIRQSLIAAPTKWNIIIYFINTVIIFFTSMNDLDNFSISQNIEDNKRGLS